MEMVNLKLDAAEKKQETTSFEPGKGPEYPYGTRLEIDAVMMEKLGIKELPEMGTEFHVVAMGKVVSTNSNESEGSEERKCFCIQLVEMALEDETKESEDAIKKSVGSLLYPAQGKKG